ncbi:hypothetical protein GCM10022419_119840 [Nonomuraea rosea]|uniref:Secreted protein n=1 Tax=Nonomuraea rosea TaxID=638574 RepID=A0ABP6ZMN6_9ACTN
MPTPETGPSVEFTRGRHGNVHLVWLVWAVMLVAVRAATARSPARAGTGPKPAAVDFLHAGHGRPSKIRWRSQLVLYGLRRVRDGLSEVGRHFGRGQKAGLAKQVE